MRISPSTFVNFTISMLSIGTAGMTQFRPYALNGRTIMNPLPDASTASVTKGVWFVFPVGTSTIKVWCSGWTGMERVYADGALVSEHRSLRRSSTHTFAVADEEYTVAFQTISLLPLHMECSLLKDGQAKQAYLLKFARRTPLSAAYFLRTAFSGANVLIGVAAGLCLHLPPGYLRQSLWMILGLAGVWQGARIRRNRGHLSIEEIKLA